MLKVVKFKFIFLFIALISGCSSSSPPDPVQPKGKWVELNTSISDIERG